MDGSIEDVIPWFTWKRRAWFYRIAQNVGYISGGFGAFTDTQWALIFGLVSALLGTGMATANTSIRGPVNVPALTESGE